MWNKRTYRFIAVLLTVCSLLSVCAFAAEEVPEEAPAAAEPAEPDSPEAPDAEAEDGELSEEPEAEPEEPFVPTVTLFLREEDVSSHEAYLHGYTDGSFRPDANLTRAEAAQMLYSLLAETAPDRYAFTDVSEDDWYYDAAGLLASGGIIDVSGKAFRADETITRGEFVTMLSRFYPETDAECSFTDVSPEDPFYPDLAKAAALGWASGYPDGSFRPGSAITRAEATALLNRALGRCYDTNYTATLVPLFPDVAADYWAFGEIAEAVLPHTVIPTGIVSDSGDPEDAESENDSEESHDAEAAEHAGETWAVSRENLLRTPGLLFIGTDQYCIGEDGLPVRDAVSNGLYYGSDGRYTSGDAEIDSYVKAVLSSVTTPEMTQLEKLRAAFLYTRDSFTYLKRHYYEIGDEGWTLEEGRTMFQTKRGNCYCYTSVFYYLCRQLGYNGIAISGVVGTARSPHGWVEIDFDGTTYIFDTELEMAWRQKGYYNYNFYMMPYSRIPWPYVKAGM